MDYYYAYGSNLHPVRVEDRLGSVKLYSTGRLHSAEIQFNKTGGDGSGKGTIKWVNNPSQCIYGAVYKISEEQERLLDGFESLGKGYKKIYLDVISENETPINCFTYQGMEQYIDDASIPFDWYKKLVVLGAEFLGFPKEYIRELKKTKSISDSNNDRLTLNSLLIERIKQYKSLKHGEL
ncbi:MAG: gamma-glutamylcyclotransferase family protein [Gracilimonas sp.]